jgi:hypothetical protein
MKQTPGNGSTVTAEQHVREIRRQTRKKYSSEECSPSAPIGQIERFAYRRVFGSSSP